MTKKHLSLIITASTFTLASQTVLAQTQKLDTVKPATDRLQVTVAQKPDNWENQAKKWLDKWQKDLKSSTDELVSQTREKICITLQGKVGERWQKYYNMRMSRLDSLENGVLALQERIEYFKAQGLNTSELEGDVTSLQGLVDEYKVAYTEFLDALEEAKVLPCKNYQDRFLPELKEAKDTWLEVRAKSQNIKDFYQSDIKPDLQALRVLLKDKNLESKED